MAALTLSRVALVNIADPKKHRRSATLGEGGAKVLGTGHLGVWFPGPRVV